MNFNFDFYLSAFVYAVWVVYIFNSLKQNKKQNHYLPNKFAEVLTIPFYLLAFVSFFTLSKGLTSNYSFLGIAEIFVGIIFLICSVVLYTYANFFEKSFPSCITTKNNQKLSGIYNYVRHPSFYIFLFISFGSAFCLQNFLIFTLAIVSHFCLYFDYMIEETEMKKKNPDYAEYLKKSNRFLPNFFKQKRD